MTAKQVNPPIIGRDQAMGWVRRALGDIKVRITRLRSDRKRLLAEQKRLSDAIITARFHERQLHEQMADVAGQLARITAELDALAYSRTDANQ